MPLELRIKVGHFSKKLVSAITAIDTSKPHYVFGHKMWLYPGSIESQAMAFGVFERDTVDVFRKLVKPGMTVLDVGAFIGYYTLLAASLVRNRGRVYAFEPNPNAFAILQRNVKENGYQEVVRLIPKALSDRSGRAFLFTVGEAAGESSLYPGNKSANEGVEVETIVLDEYLAHEGWPEVHVAKIDVEGAEVDVLKGMRETIARNPWIKLIVEFNPGTQMKSRGHYTELMELLVKLGFRRFYAIRHGLLKMKIPKDNEKLLRLCETTRYVNILCDRG